MNRAHLRTIGWERAERLLTAAARAGVSIMLWGAPGVGKTALAHALARRLERPLIELVGSQMDPTDVGGQPFVDRDRGDFCRWPMRQIREASETPSVIFIDELTSAPRLVAASLMKLYLERRAGDVEVHPDTVFVLAANPPEIATSGVEVAAPEVGRWAQYWFEPTLDEIASHFQRAENLGGYAGDDEYRQRVAALAHDYFATVSIEPALLQLDPPDASTTDGASWASPRSIEHAIRLAAALGDDPDSEDLSAALAGAIGENAARAYLSIRSLRAHVPSIDDIVADPSGCTLPQESYQIAAIGQLAQVARRDSWAAWIYAARLNAELANACSHVLFQYADSADSRNQADGDRARNQLLGSMGEALGV